MQSLKTLCPQRQLNQPVIGVKRKLWREDDQHADSEDKEFAKTSNKIICDADFRCYFCDFKSDKYQEVHHFDNNHQNNTPENLKCCCNLCHMVHHIGMLALMNGGFIAPVPELTQTEINHICRANFTFAYMAQKKTASPQTKDNANKLAALYSLLEDRADKLKKIHKQSSNLMIFAEIMSQIPDEMYEDRQKMLNGLRVVPTTNAFQEKQLEHYALKGHFVVEKWTSIYKQLVNHKSKF